MSNDRPTHDPIPALWFNRNGAGPDELALRVNPRDKEMRGDRLVSPPTLGLMVVRTSALVLLGRDMVDGGFLMDRASVVTLHQQLGEWLKTTPENADGAKR